MNSIYGALGLTIPLLLLIGYVVVFKNKTISEPLMTQSLNHHKYVMKKKYLDKINKKSQSKLRQEKENVRVIVVENEAFWIKDNTFYTAPLINHFIDKDAAVRVDTSHMDKVQLDKMLFIVDKLREGVSDDSRGSRDA